MDYTIWSTSDCNMKCSYCYEGMNKKSLYMTKKVADEVIAFLYRNQEYHHDKNITINFLGGEPLLNFSIIKYIYEQLQAFEEYKIKYALTTNGTIMNDEIFQFLVNNINYGLSVSIDGLKEINNKHRIMHNGAGTYDLAIDTAQKLLDYRKDLIIRMTVNSDTVEQLSSSIISFINMGFIFLSPVVNEFDTKWNEEKMALLESELRMVKEYILNKDVYVGYINSKSKYSGRCSGGIKSFQIYPNGDIYPCSCVAGQENYIIGSVKRGLNSEKIKEFSILYGQKSNECIGCENITLCNTQKCKFLNKMVTGDFLAPSPVQCAVEGIKLKLCI